MTYIKRLGENYARLEKMATSGESRQSLVENGIRVIDGEAQPRNRLQNRFNLGWFGRVNKDLLVFKLYYFFTFTGQAFVKPFLPVFLRHVGMSAEQTGMILGLRPVAGIIGAPLFGGLADKYRKHKVVMMVMCITSSALFFSLVWVRPSKQSDTVERNLCSNGSLWNVSKEGDFIGNIWPCSGINCSRMDAFLSQNCENHSVVDNKAKNAVNKGRNEPGQARDNNATFFVMGLIFFLKSLFEVFNTFGDAATVKYLTSIGQGGNYGKQRLWGAVGWGSTAVVSGFVIDESAKRLHQSQFLLAFCGNLLFSIATAVTIFKLPMQHLESRSKPRIIQNLRTIFSDLRIVTFLLAILIMGTCMTTIETYLFWFLQDLNASHLLMGLAICMTCMAEVPVMFFSGYLIKYLGHHGVLYLTLVCYTVRYLCYSFLHNAWYVLAIEPLHGVTFGAMWAATTSYGGIISPEGLAATVMGLVYAMHFGLGRLIAGFGGGFIYSDYGPRVLFRSLAVTSAVTCVFFAVSQKLLKKKSQVGYSNFHTELQDANTDIWDLEMKEVNLDSGD